MLTREIASSIVKETSIRIDRNVNIMDTEGRIIASMDEKRIDSIHEGARQVVISGESLHIYPTKEKEWEGGQPGINLPILFKNKVIGVIGVTGNPSLMGDIGELVKMTTELMINQEFIASQFEWKQRMKEMIIEQLIKKSPSFAEIERGIGMLNLEFSPPYLGVIIEFRNQIFQKQEVIQQVEQLLGEEKSISGFINIQQLYIAVWNIDEKKLIEKMEAILRLMKKFKLSIRLSNSLPFYTLDGFHQSYIDCNLALEISDPSSEIVSFSNIEAKSLIHQLDEKVTNRFVKRILNDMDDIKLKNLDSFFKNGLHIQKSADALFIHRNTLIYRLNKITEDTGYNPRNFHDAVILQVALWIYQK